MLRYHGAVALFRLHSVTFLNQDVCEALVGRLRVDEQLHAHDALQDGVQRDDERLALHQRDEALASSAAPRVAQDDGLGRGTDSDDLELLCLAKRAVRSYCDTLSCFELRVPTEARCSNLEGLRQKVRRKLPEAAAGDDSCVAKVEEKHLQE